MNISQESHQWMTKFKKAHGRAPRILHIGNIANNAYLNAKFLNGAGFDCDVICYDYYHIMGCPEWEDANFADYGDQFKPNWAAAGVHNFSRPKWFAQGPLRECIDYLIAKREGKVLRADLLWRDLGLQNGSLLPKIGIADVAEGAWVVGVRRKTRKLFRALAFAVVGRGLVSRIAVTCTQGRVAAKTKSEFIRAAAAWSLLTVILFIRIVGFFFRLGHSFLTRLCSLAWRTSRLSKEHEHSLDHVVADNSYSFDDVVAELVQKFAEAFPSRNDSLSANDLEGYRGIMPYWRNLFKHYDLVHAYATDPILPLLAKCPYVAFEHGTIRNIPFEPTIQGRLCAAAYRFSNSVIITNADNFLAAQKLKLPKFEFIPHPVNDVVSSSHSHYENLHRELDADFVIFHPSRQHWNDERHPDWEKGNDYLIEAFAKFVAVTNRRAAAVFVDWGASVTDSKQLIERLGVTDRVKWVVPMSHKHMIDMVCASDVLADQFFLGAFGSTTPKALACGRPVLLYLNASIHEWCFSELPPVVNVHTADEIYAGLEQLYRDKVYYQNVCDEGRKWYSRWHSRQIVMNKLASVYARAIG